MKYNKRCFKHGYSKENKKLYSIYLTMKRRCNIPTDKDYHNYGGRGIKVCDGWTNNIHSFWEWAINSGYKDGLTLDRVNNDGNYEPKNCKWVDRKAQARNKRNNRLITIDGITKTVIEWSEFYNIDKGTLKSRLDKGLNKKEDLFRRII